METDHGFSSSVEIVATPSFLENMVCEIKVSIKPDKLEARRQWTTVTIDLLAVLNSVELTKVL
jgi:hypothetical protein